ncbi:terminase [Jiangella mangrovi]|uniref:Uncharacterized protein n=1 Tax=Jiangella mangrovi TaxID=1524084 RepID=A0A7W9GLZ6_9ACTN|nr:terminase [Jiangella mangrovi]MBB5785991.1 hypothetical protein [Jiangella mangrovi]
MGYRPPDPPAGLAESGRALWTDVAGRFVIEAEKDRLQLLQACRTADLCDRLAEVFDKEGPMSESSQGVRVHPAAAELRQQRIVLARLLAALGVPSEAAPARGIYAIGGA